MSGFWSIYIIVLVLLNIFGAVALLIWTARRRSDDRPEHETTGHVWDGNLTELNRPLPRWWLWLFLLTVVFALAYLVLYPGLGSFRGTLNWTSGGEHSSDVAATRTRQDRMFARFKGMDLAAMSRDPEALRVGRNVFVNNCATCHGSDARGAPGFPNLTDDDWLHGGTPEQIETTILDGRQGTMPPMAATLGEQGVAEAAAYVYGLSGRKLDAHLQILADAGKPRFETMCVACHGVDGKGNQQIGAPNLTDRIWLYGGSIETLIRTVGQGRNGRMPAHRNLLGEDRVRFVAAYVYSLSQEGADAR